MRTIIPVQALRTAKVVALELQTIASAGITVVFFFCSFAKPEYNILAFLVNCHIII